MWSRCPSVNCRGSSHKSPEHRTDISSKKWKLYSIIPQQPFCTGCGLERPKILKPRTAAEIIGQGALLNDEGRDERYMSVQRGHGEARERLPPRAPGEARAGGASHASGYGVSRLSTVLLRSEMICRTFLERQGFEGITVSTSKGEHIAGEVPVRARRRLGVSRWVTSLSWPLPPAFAPVEHKPWKVAFFTAVTSFICRVTCVLTDGATPALPRQVPVM